MLGNIEVSIVSASATGTTGRTRAGNPVVVDARAMTSDSRSRPSNLAVALARRGLSQRRRLAPAAVEVAHDAARGKPGSRVRTTL